MIRVERMLSVARRRLLLIDDNRRLTEAASLLADGARHLIVVCDSAGSMVGVVTRTDIVRQISHCQGCACTAACTMVMTKEVICCRPDDWLREVWTTMKGKGLRGVPVVDAQRRPIGLVSARDALEMLLSEVEREEELLKDYVMCGSYR